MKAGALEEVWARHQASDVTVVDSLALEFAKLAPKKWAALQKKALAAKAGETGPADALVAFAGQVASRLVLEKTIARAYRQAEAHDHCIEFAAKALAATPRWDPLGVADVCNTIAWSLFLSGRHAESVTWAERAVASDPTHPFALGTLCEALGKVDPARAVGVWKFLRLARHDASVWGDYVLPSPVPKAPDYPFSLASFAKFTDEDAHKLRIAHRFDTNLRPFDALHGHAIVLAGAGRLAPAYLAATLAVLAAAAQERIQAAQVKGRLRPNLDDEVMDRIDAGKGRFSHDPEERADAVDDLVKANDREALGDMVFDPVYGVSMAAIEGLIRAGDTDATKRLAPYLELASALEHKTGQSILYDRSPKPFDLLSGAKADKPAEEGTGLVERVIGAVKKAVKEGGREQSLSIPAPEPVPAAVLEKLVLAEGIPLPPSLRAWLAFDGGWMGRTWGWFKDPAAPVLAPLPVHALVHEHISDVFAPAFLELPGKLADAKALPLDIGSESMRMLALVPGPTGEYPVIYIDVDDNPIVGIEAPSFDVWLASTAGLVGDVARQYEKEIKKVGKFFFGGKEPYAYLDYAEAPEGFAARVKAERRAAIEEGKRLAAAWKALAPKAKGKPAIPTLDEPKLAEALGEAIEGEREARVRAFLEDAKARFPKGKAWKTKAIAAATVKGDVALVQELLALGADVNAKYYLQNRLVHCAAEREDVTLLRVLLDAGADIEARGYSKQTPLHDACDDRFVEAARLLIERKADVNARNENKRTPLLEASQVFGGDFAVEFPKTVAIATMLLDAGADVNATNSQTTPLHEAIEQSNRELVRLLVERGADLEAKDYAGDNALMAARKAQDPVVVDLLRARGATSSAKNKEGVSVDDLVQADGLTPSVFEVRFQCSDARQKVRIRARWVPPNYHAMDRGCTERIEALTLLAEGGLAGSDAWPPGAGKGEAISTGLPAGRKGPKKTKDANKAPVELEHVAIVAGVSPAALAIYLRGLYDTLGYDLAELEIEGELPLDGSARSVDTSRARGWLVDPASEPYRAYPGLTSPLGAHPARDTFGRVLPSASGSAAVAAFAKAFDVFTALLLPPEVKDLRDRAALRRRARATVKVLETWTTLQIAKAFDGTPRRTDGPLLRAAFANGVEKLAAQGALGAAEWSLGVAGTPAAEGLADELAGQDVIEVSPSSRAMCPKCKESIEKGELRFAEKTFVGARYFHLSCAATRLPTRLQGALARYDDEVPDREDLEAMLAKAAARGEKKSGAASPAEGGAGATAATGAFPYAEIAKTGRSTCVKCAKPVAKGTLRIAVPREVETPQGKMTRPGYLHVACARGFEGVSLEAVLANTAGLTAEESETLRRDLAS